MFLVKFEFPNRQHIWQYITKRRSFRSYFLFGFGLIFGSLILLILSVYVGLWGSLPNTQQIAAYKHSKATEVLAANGDLIGKFYIYDRQPIPFAQIPEDFVQALVATEDARFFEHSGIDYKSLFRVLFKSILLQDRSSGGGSTISQQLAKNMYPRKNYGKFGIVINKIREIIIAKRIEKAYSKEEILTNYLNTVPFSDNTFGIESAAKKFFNVSAHELSLEQSAVIVGMLKASYLYNPRLFPERSQLRRNTVLHQMLKQHYINEERYTIESKKPLELSYRSFDHTQGIAPYFRAQVRRDLEKWCKTHKTPEGKPYNIYTSGLRVHTTLNIPMQKVAEKAMKTHMQKLQAEFENEHGKRAFWKNDKNYTQQLVQTSQYKALANSGLSKKEILDSLKQPRQLSLFEWKGTLETKGSVIDSLQHYSKFLNCGFLAIEPTTGAVQSWVGGIDFEHFQYDHVEQSKRQVGSTFKPFLYTAALENGMAPCAHIPARTIRYNDLDGWTPKNSAGIDPELNYSLKYALSRSVNTVAVKVLEDTGIKRTTAMVKKLGITADIPQVASMALGTAQIPLAEVAGAYASYVNNGKSVKPYYITKIEATDGTILEQFQPRIAEKAAFKESTRQTMLEFMKATVNEGTARRLRSTYQFNNAIAGKTGTTQNNKDAWFTGVMPKLVAVTWVGADDHRIGFKSTRLGQGANAALPLFANFLKGLNADKEFRSITRAQFDPASPEVLARLECEDTQAPGFFRKLFTNPGKTKSSRFDRTRARRPTQIFKRRPVYKPKQKKRRNK